MLNIKKEVGAMIRNWNQYMLRRQLLIAGAMKFLQKHQHLYCWIQKLQEVTESQRSNRKAVADTHPSPNSHPTPPNPQLTLTTPTQPPPNTTLWKHHSWGPLRVCALLWLPVELTIPKDTFSTEGSKAFRTCLWSLGYAEDVQQRCHEAGPFFSISHLISVFNDFVAQ